MKHFKIALLAITFLSSLFVFGCSSDDPPPPPPPPSSDWGTMKWGESNWANN